MGNDSISRESLTPAVASIYGMVVGALLVGVFASTSYLIGTRPLHVGTDTYNYYSSFYSILNGYDTRLEPLFELFVKLTTLFGDSPTSFFITQSLTVILLFSLTTYHFGKLAGRSVGLLTILQVICLSLAFSFLSSWFFVGVANGLRQGLALAVLYLASALIFRGGGLRFIGLVLLLASGLTHYSSVLIFPFLFMFLFSLKRIVIISIVSALGYAAGLNEKVVAVVSLILPVDLYHSIKFYAEGSDSYVGFNLLFVLYTVFFILLAYVVFSIGKRKGWLYSPYAIEAVVKMYCLLSTCYFIFGFGAFSNRFGFMAWFFIPILISISLSSLVGIRKYVLLFAPVLMLMSLAYFLTSFAFLGS